MSETLCTLRTKGGGGEKYTETSLWTNSAPTSSFASQAVTLSESIDNFKYIKIKFRLSTSNSTTSETVYSVGDFKTYTSTTALGISGGLVGQPVASQGYVRKAIYSSSTQIQFDTAYRLAVNDANTSYLIPLEILGLNELDHGKLVMDSGAFTVASGVTDTITCGFRPKKIYIYNLVGTTSMFVNIYDENVSSTYTIGAYRSSSSTNGCNSYALGGNNGVIQSITDTGFTFKGSTVMSTLYYTAIG